jgi:hypothetical protein
MTPMTEHADLAVAAGHAWAEQKAEKLADVIPASDWPETWDARFAGELPFSRDELSDRERYCLAAIAHHAAAERWRELVIQFRDQDDFEEYELEQEAQALHLLETVRDTLPDGLTIDHDGPRVFLVDSEGGERTVSSLREAWLAMDEFEQRRSLTSS